LAIILDVFSRRIVGWAMGTTLQKNNVSLEEALSGRVSRVSMIPPEVKP